MTQRLNNVLLVSGSGRNVGKTTFICKVLHQCEDINPVAVKITPHFHTLTAGLIPVEINDNFKIYTETNRNSEKDSSLFLTSGASQVFYIQARDQYLAKAFDIVMKKLKPDQPVVVESAALRHCIVPGLFIIIRKAHESVKPSVQDLMQLADEVIVSNGKSFSISPNAVTFNCTWKIKQR